MFVDTIIGKEEQVVVCGIQWLKELGMFLGSQKQPKQLEYVYLMVGFFL